MNSPVKNLTETPEHLLLADDSGAGGLIGYRSFDAGDGIAACTLRLGPQHMNRLGVLHGGIVAMLLDNASGLAVRKFSRDKENPAVTVSQLHDQDGKLLATASGAFKLLER